MMLWISNIGSIHSVHSVIVNCLIVLYGCVFVSMYMICHNFQEELFKIMHTILVNSETRDAAMSYLMAGVQRNHKRSQIQVSGRINNHNKNCSSPASPPGSVSSMDISFVSLFNTYWQFLVI